MGWDGSGSFSRNAGFATGANVWEQAAEADRDIRADDQDTHDQDLAEGLENCLTRDGQNSPTANLPMNDKKHTGVADATEDAEYASWGQVLGLVGRYYAPAAVGGTGDAIQLTTDPELTAYRAGLIVRFIVEANNTGNTTLQVDALTAPRVRKVAGYDLDSDDWRVGDWVEVTHDGVDWQWTGGTNARAAGQKLLADQDAYDALTGDEPYAGVEYLIPDA